MGADGIDAGREGRGAGAGVVRGIFAQRRRGRGEEGLGDGGFGLGASDLFFVVIPAQAGIYLPSRMLGVRSGDGFPHARE